jgi:hypothetical protein
MKHILIIIISLLPILARSQSIATYDSEGNVYYSDTIKLPFPVAKQITKELVSCDSLKAVHQLTVEELTLTQNKVILKDSIISGFKEKCATYDTMLNNEKQKFSVQGEWLKQISKENKSLKRKLIYTKISMSAIIAFLGYLFVTK